MYHNHIFQNVNEALPRLLHELVTNGEEVGSRAGRTFELTHIGITLTQPWQREVLTLERKPSIAAQIAETMWVLSGRDDMEFLSHYLPRAKDFSDDGETWRAGYGKRLRAWPKRDGMEVIPIDQLAYAVNALKKSSLTRQAVMTLWDPQIDTNPGKDIPCNDWISFSNRLGKLDMHVALRSNDVIWGWSGINAFEWSAMLEVVAGLVGVQVGSLHFSTTSFHLYDRHWNKASKIIKADQNAAADVVKDSPRFDIGEDKSLDNFDGACDRWFRLEEKIRNGVYVDNQVNDFPEPMLRSWLRVLQWWWTGQREHLAPLTGTALELATYRSIQPKMIGGQRMIEDDRVMVGGQPGAITFDPNSFNTHIPSDFLEFAVRTHNEKHAAYGDSWKRRGEMLGILANIARKVDRLGGSETADETSADTAMDLMVYLAKYRSWLTDNGAPEPFLSHGFEAGKLSDTPAHANAIMMVVEEELRSDLNLEEPDLQEYLEMSLKVDFDKLEYLVTQHAYRYEHVDAMLRDAYRLARLLWEASRVLDETDEYQGADVD